MWPLWFEGMDVNLLALVVVGVVVAGMLAVRAFRGESSRRAAASEAADIARRRCELRAELKRLVPDSNSAENLLRSAAQQANVAASSPAAFERAIERARESALR